MNRRSLRTLGVILSIVIVVGVGWMLLRPRPTLAGLDRLIATGQHHAAEQILLDYVAAYPDDQPARVLLARAEVTRPDPNPQKAIEALESVRPRNPRAEARVRAIRGQAYFLDERFVPAEAEWARAVDLDPTTPDVGWGLLNLYALQGRDDEAARLALRLYDAETDAHDRIQLLLQMIRFDAHAIEPGSLVSQLEPIVVGHPEDLASGLSYATALVQSGRIDEGLERLSAATRAHPDRPDAWARRVEALRQAGQVEEVAAALDHPPPGGSSLPRALAARGWLASQRQEWPAAADALIQAYGARPWDPATAFSLRLALQQAGRTADLDRLGPAIQAAIDSKDHLRRLYDRIDAAVEAGAVAPSPADAREVAATLRPIGRGREADLWDRLATAAPGGPQ